MFPHEMQVLVATTIAEVPKDRFDEMDPRYNSRSYRCALHMCTMLRRPWQESRSFFTGCPRNPSRFGNCFFSIRSSRPLRSIAYLHREVASKDKEFTFSPSLQPPVS